MEHTRGSFRVSNLEVLVNGDGAAVVHRTSSQRSPSGITPDTRPRRRTSYRTGPGPIVFVPSLPQVRARSPRVRRRNAARAKYSRPAPAPGPRRACSRLGVVGCCHRVRHGMPLLWRCGGGGVGPGLAWRGVGFRRGTHPGGWLWLWDGCLGSPALRECRRSRIRGEGEFRSLFEGVSRHCSNSSHSGSDRSAIMATWLLTQPDLHRVAEAEGCARKGADGVGARQSGVRVFCLNPNEWLGGGYSRGSPAGSPWEGSHSRGPP